MLTQVCGRIGITAPTSFASSPDPQIMQLIALANEEGQELAARYPWQSLTVEKTFSSVAAEIQGTVAALAGTDFKYIFNSIMWDRTLLRPVLGPLLPAQWQELKARNITGPWSQYRIRGGNILFIPIPTAGDTIAFEYVSKNWIAAVPQSFVSANTGEIYTLNGAVSLANDGTNNYLSLPGTSVSFASTPEKASLDILGDIDLRARIDPYAWVSTTFMQIIGKRNASGNQISYGMRLDKTTGFLTLGWSANGSTEITVASTVPVPGVVGTPLWVRATLDVDDGAGGKTVTFYTSSDGVTWTMLGAAVNSAGTTSIFASTTLLLIGARSDTATPLPFTGKIYQALVYNGIAGTQVASFNANDTSTTNSIWANDADTALLDEQIMAQGLLWRWQAAKGVSYSENFDKYERLVADAMGRDGGKPTLNLEGLQGDYPFGVTIALGSWNV